MRRGPAAAGSTGRRRRLIGGLWVTLLVGLLMVVPAAPAWAHATLETTTPAENSVVAKSPAEVTLTYDETVGTSAGSVEVLAPDGTRVDTGRISSRDAGRTVVGSLRADLAPGTYTILWRVLSADTHTVFGAVTFSVKTQSSASAAAAAEAQLAGAGVAAEDALAISRFVLYAGLVLLVGGLAFLLVLWPAGRSVAAARRVPWVGWALTVVGSAAGLLLQGPYSLGLPLSAVFDPTPLVGVLDSRYGIATIVRLALLAVAAVLLAGMARLPRRTLTAALAVVGVGVLASTSAITHAGIGDLDVLAWPSDMVHIAAASAWLGGLVVLLAVLLRCDPADIAPVMPRWSRYAEISVAVLVLTGVFAGWRQVREIGALTSTDYGRLLLVKSAVVILMLALGASGRRWVQRHAVQVAAESLTSAAAEPEQAAVSAGGSSAPASRRAIAYSAPAPPPQDHPVSLTRADVRRLRRSVLVEALFGVVVLGVTAVLVATTPAEKAYFPVVDETADVTAALRVHLNVDPARTGLNAMHLAYTDPNGTSVDLVAVSARWTHEGGDVVVPVDSPTHSALGHYDAANVDLPESGTWKVNVVSQTGDFDSFTTVFTVRIR